MFDVKTERRETSPTSRVGDAVFPGAWVVRYGPAQGPRASISCMKAPYGVFQRQPEGVRLLRLQGQQAAERKFQTTGGWLGITDKYWMDDPGARPSRRKVDASIKA